MVHTNCSIYGCLSNSKKNRDLKFHRFPRDARCEFWVNACQRPDLKDKSKDKLYNMHVCGLHFEEWMYMKNKLKSAAIPVLKLPSASKHSIATQSEAPKIEILHDLYSGGKSTEITRQQFLQGCDKFSLHNLSKLVKAQTKLKLQSENNRPQLISYSILPIDQEGDDDAITEPDDGWAGGKGRAGLATSSVTPEVESESCDESDDTHSEHRSPQYKVAIQGSWHKPAAVVNERSSSSEGSTTPIFNTKRRRIGDDQDAAISTRTVHTSESQTPSAEALTEITKRKEFYVFGESIAAQLDSMPLEVALGLQLEIQHLITSKRLSKMRQGAAQPLETINDDQSRSYEEVDSPETVVIKIECPDDST